MEQHACWGWGGGCGVSRREAQPWASPQLCILVSWGNVPTLQKACGLHKGSTCRSPHRAEQCLVNWAHGCSLAEENRPQHWVAAISCCCVFLVGSGQLCSLGMAGAWCHLAPNLSPTLAKGRTLG